MIKEFRDFLLRGNLVELAVAFVMGLAFAALVTSFVDDLVMPIVAMIFGEPDFGGLTSRSTTRSSATARSSPQRSRSSRPRRRSSSSS
jgi:large conductance mechanosensitive channel